LSLREPYHRIAEGVANVIMALMDVPSIHLQPIGVIRTPFKMLENMPIQPKGAADVIGTVEVHPELAAGLKDLDGFSHVYLLYHFHRAAKTTLVVKPFLDQTARGVFATRAPVRPNHLGLSVVELLSVKDNVLTVRGIDVLDGTPLLDIKPYVEQFDHPAHSRSGWMAASDSDIQGQRSDQRFI